MEPFKNTFKKQVNKLSAFFSNKTLLLGKFKTTLIKSKPVTFEQILNNYETL
jgi:hypothetical protein